MNKWTAEIKSALERSRCRAQKGGLTPGQRAVRMVLREFLPITPSKRDLDVLKSALRRHNKEFSP